MLATKGAIGKRDELIVIQEGTNSTDEYNAPTVTWSTFHTCWAEVKDYSGGSGEKYEADQLTAVRVTSFNIRYKEGVREKMRILYDSRIYDIEFIGKPDRRRSLDIRAVLLDET